MPDVWWVTARHRLPTGTGVTATKADSISSGIPSASAPRPSFISRSSAYMHLSAHLLGLAVPFPPLRGLFPPRVAWSERPLPLRFEPLARAFSGDRGLSPSVVDGVLAVGCIDSELEAGAAGRSRLGPGSDVRGGSIEAKSPMPSRTTSGLPFRFPSSSVSSSEWPRLRSARMSRERAESKRSARLYHQGDDHQYGAQGHGSASPHTLLLL